MLDIFLRNTRSVTYKRNKHLREIWSPSLFPRTTKQNECSIKEGNKKCDICKNFLVVSPYFTCFATKRKYKIKGTLKCDSRNIIYLMSCKCCGKQYVRSATGYKERYRIHESDINTGKIGCGEISCGAANHPLNDSRSSTSKFEYFTSINRKSFCTKRWRYWQSFVGRRKMLASRIIYVKSEIK